MLSLRIQNIFEGELAFQADLNLKREIISGRNLNRIFIQFPWMTVKVFAAIHWQALILFLKGVPVVKHQGIKPKNKQEILDEA